MELSLILGYTAVCVAVFTILRIPLNRWTVPSASIGGAVMIFSMVQLLNHYHPYSDTSRQFLTATPITPSVAGELTELQIHQEEYNLVAWFQQNNLLRLNDGSAVEVAFDSIPGKVFSGQVDLVLSTQGGEYAWTQDDLLDPPAIESQLRIPVLIKVTDPRYAIYKAQVPAGSHAQAAIYGDELHQLAVVRKTLLRMSAWMNYLSVFS